MLSSVFNAAFPLVPDALKVFGAYLLIDDALVALGYVRDHGLLSVKNAPLGLVHALVEDVASKEAVVMGVAGFMAATAAGSSPARAALTAAAGAAAAGTALVLNDIRSRLAALLPRSAAA